MAFAEVVTQVDIHHEMPPVVFYPIIIKSGQDALPGEGVYEDIIDVQDPGSKKKVETGFQRPGLGPKA